MHRRQRRHRLQGWQIAGTPLLALVALASASASPSLFVQTPPAQSPPVQAPATKEPPKPDGPKTVTNVFVDTDLRQVINEIAGATGTTIVADSSVGSQNVSIDFKNASVEQALEKLTLFGGLYWKKKGDTYLVTNGLPEAPLFREFSRTERFTLGYQTAESLAALIPTVYKPYVLIDRTSSTVTITAPEALIPRILDDLRVIDAPTRQIVVEALVTEVTQLDTDDFGFSWNWRNFSLDSGFGLSYTSAGLKDVATLKALISNGRAKLRANPRITAFEGREAQLNVGQETYYSILTGNTAYPTAQVQLIKTGVTLRFTGFVGRDGSVTLRLDPEVSDAVVSVNGNPTTNVRRASTYVRVPAGETIAIGGMLQDSSSDVTDRVPVLSQVPVVGGLFKRKSTSHRRVETIILITPRIDEGGIGNPSPSSMLGQEEARSKSSAPSSRVSLNSATLKELERLPGVGEARAKAIVEYRERRKGFQSVDELQDVKGIGAATFAKIKDLVRV